MQKKVFFILLLGILSISIVSAFSFSEFFSKITGRAITENDLIAHYKFDGSASNEKGGSLTLYGNPTYAEGKSGQAISVDGNDYGEQNSLAQSINPRRGTFSAWIKMDPSITQDSNIHAVVGTGLAGNGTNYIVIEKRNTRTMSMQYRTSGNPFSASTGQTFYQSYQWDSWNHITGTWNETQLNFYVNGVKYYYSNLPSSASFVPFNTFRVGVYPWLDNWYFKGQIDEIKVFNRVLTQSEVTELYASSGGTSGNTGGTTQTCNNNIREGTETCEVGETQACTLNGQSGTQTCNSQCSGWNTCVVQTQPTQTCNNGIIEGNEVCDIGKTNKCSINGFIGSQTCEPDCTAWRQCEASSTPLTCTDSDTGENIAVLGNTSTNIPSSNVDVCLNSTDVTEYSCSADKTITSRTIACGQGKICQDGACTILTGNPPSCADTDGKDYAVRGSVTYGSDEYSDICIKDQVADLTASNDLKEYYCEDNNFNTEVHNCPNGCSDGACLPSSGEGDGEEGEETGSEETSTCPAESNGLFAYINFNGDAFDLAGGRNGAPEGEIEYTAGIIDEAISFPGNKESYMIIPSRDLVNNKEQLSISFWYKSSEKSDALFSVAEGKRGNELLIVGQENPSIYYKGKITRVGLKRGEYLNDNEWHYLVVTIDSAEGVLKAYIDGSLKKENTKIKKKVLNASGIVFGQDQDGGAFKGFEKRQAFEGSIDEFSIFSRILSAEEVEQLYNSGYSMNMCRFTDIDAEARAAEERERIAAALQ